MPEAGYLDTRLSQTTQLFGLRLWVVLSIGFGSCTLLILVLLSLWLSASVRSKSKKALDLSVQTDKKQPNCLPSTITYSIPPECKDIKEVVVECATQDFVKSPQHLQESLQATSSTHWSKRISIDAVALESMPIPNTVITRKGEHPPGVRNESIWDGEKEMVTFEYTSGKYVTPHFYPIQSKLHFSQNADMRVHAIEHHHNNIMQKNGAHTVLNEKGGHNTYSQETMENAARVAITGGWGQWYTLDELEVATDQFAEKNILGKGGYGIVYQGILPRGLGIAVKNLMNNRGQAEQEFRVEVDAIGRVRHKNLVRLLGFCAEGSHRLLVYEYVNNGNLDQWLHGALGKMQPIPWDARMRIVLGIAKGLAYLHEDLEPKVVHRDVKSSNILLDKNWNPKISDFGLAKLLGAGMSHITTRVMGTFGYVAPEYASTGMLTEQSDVYSFGVLMMEIITGRDPVDYSRPVGEINLVDWMKMMVGSRRTEEVADVRLQEKPSSRALKRALLVALRCVDPDGLRRPQMGHVLHMLEADDVAFHTVCRSTRTIKGSLVT